MENELEKFLREHEQLKTKLDDKLSRLEFIESQN